MRSVVFLFPMFAAVLVSCGKTPATPGHNALAPVTAELRVIESREVPVFEEVVGTVRPRKEAQVTAKVTGRLLEMSAIPGRRVKTGEVLAKLDVGELDAALARAEAALVQADRDLARFRTLRDSGGVAVAEFEQAESRQGMAAATVAEMKTMVQNAAVTAPFDGTITRKYLEPGDLASPERAIFAMEDSSLLRLEIGVAEALSGGIKIGDKFRVGIAGAGEGIEGIVSEVSPSADVGSRTFLVKLDLPPIAELRAGQFGRAHLPRGTRQALTVPDSALVSRGQMDYVFVAVENTARLRIVRVGAKRGGETEILAGLDPGEAILAQPSADLQDGQPLKSN